MGGGGGGVGVRDIQPLHLNYIFHSTKHCNAIIQKYTGSCLSLAITEIDFGVHGARR